AAHQGNRLAPAGIRFDARGGDAGRRHRSRPHADPRLRRAGTGVEARVIWYFAYGSNMNPERLVDGRLRREGVDIGRRIGGRLDGWRLAFDKIARGPAGVGAGNIVVAPGGCVHGTLNEMPEAGLKVLDVWEGVADGHYERRLVPVVRADDGETVKAVTYVALR